MLSRFRTNTVTSVDCRVPYGEQERAQTAHRDILIKTAVITHFVDQSYEPSQRRRRLQSFKISLPGGRRQVGEVLLELVVPHAEEHGVNVLRHDVGKVGVLHHCAVPTLFELVHGRLRGPSNAGVGGWGGQVSSVRDGWTTDPHP